MAITGTDGRFVRVNRSLAAMLGREPQQLAGVAVRDVTHPAHHEDDREAMRALAAGERNTYSAEKRYLRADGSEAWVALHVTVVRNADGGPQYFLSQMADIGERRAAEHALAESEERFRTLASASPVGIFAIAEDGRLAYANERLREIFDMPGEVLDGEPWLERVAGRGPRAPRRRVPPRAGAGRARLARRARRGRHRPLGAHPHGAGLEGRGRSRWASSARSRTSPSRSPRAWRSPPARPSTGCWPSTRPTSCRATPSTAPSSTRRPVLAGHARLGARRDARPDARASSAMDHPDDVEIVERNWVGALRERAARAPPPTAPGAATARSCGWRRPSAPCAGPAARRSRWCASRATSPSARAPSSSSPTGRCTTRSPACPTARCSSTASARRCGARAGATRGVAVLFLDLDRFKVVNDSLGHEAGDRLLVDVAKRLSSALRPSDTLARFGGDELTLLCEDIGDGEPTRARSPSACSTRFAEPFLVAGRRGVPAGQHRHRALARRLETARGPHPRRRRRDVPRQGPRPGRRDLRRGDAPATSATASRLESRAAPRHRARRAAPALPAAGRRSPTARIEGFEALVRWEHPERGLVPPGAFIPLAEETGLIVPIGAWVLREACATLRRIIDETGMATLQVSVNVSPRQLQQPDFVAQVRAALDDNGLEPELPRARDHRERDHGDRRRGASCARSRTSACAWRSTTSAPATRRSRTCAASRSTCSRSTARSSPALGDGQGSSIAGAIVSLAHALGPAHGRRGHRGRASSAAPCWRWAATSGRASSSRGRCRSTT